MKFNDHLYQKNFGAKGLEIKKTLRRRAVMSPSFGGLPDLTKWRRGVSRRWHCIIVL